MKSLLIAILFSFFALSTAQAADNYGSLYSSFGSEYGFGVNLAGPGSGWINHSATTSGQVTTPVGTSSLYGTLNVNGSVFVPNDAPTGWASSSFSMTGFAGASNGVFAPTADFAGGAFANSYLSHNINVSTSSGNGGSSSMNVNVQLNPSSSLNFPFPVFTPSVPAVSTTVR